MKQLTHKIRECSKSIYCKAKIKKQSEPGTPKKLVLEPVCRQAGNRVCERSQNGEQYFLGKGTAEAESERTGFSGIASGKPRASDVAANCFLIFKEAGGAFSTISIS